MQVQLYKQTETTLQSHIMYLFALHISGQVDHYPRHGAHHVPLRMLEQIYQ